MKTLNIFLSIISISLVSYYFNIEPVTKPVELTKEVVSKEEISINVLKEDSSIEKINLEEYIIGVLAAEMPASFHIEALKAQAIASRTYALHKIENSTKEYDVTTTVTTQAYITIEEMKTKWNNEFDTYYNKIKEAVDSTKDMVLTNNSEVISAYYFSMSNGYTEDSINVFNLSLDYTKSVDSSWDQNLNNFSVDTTFTKESFCNLLNIDCKSITISNILKNETNRVESITINDKVYTGIDIRNILSLRSTDFTIIINETNIVINTKGYGHGVGMSQYGANELAKQNKTYKEILTHYYQNIELTNYSV